MSGILQLTPELHPDLAVLPFGRRVLFAPVVGFEDEITGSEEDTFYFGVLPELRTHRGEYKFVMLARRG